ncbi:DedA family protein [Candidatus Kaiserbacteria bacterium]|nr:DedA family protein [Candidatus Kaiserbacteria bacterium]
MPDLDLVSIIQFVGYPGLFTAVFLESGVFFGFFLPGASMLFTAGLLASQGVFNVWILIPLLTLAAILGDSAGYWFGAKVGIKLFERKDSRFFRQEHLVRARDFYEHHGVLAIVLARFLPIIRTFAPIVAGIVQMRYRTFLIYNITGAVIWGAGVTFIGFYLGEKVPGVEKYLTPIILLIILATCIPVVREYLRQSKKNKESSSPA